MQGVSSEAHSFRQHPSSPVMHCFPLVLVGFSVQILVTWSRPWSCPSSPP